MITAAKNSNDRMNDSTGVATLGRRLTRLGALLLACAIAAFVWAVGFTRGVDGLLEGMVIAVAGFLVPAAALLWIGWVLGNVSHEQDDAPPVPAAPETGRRQALVLARDYLVAVAAVAVATAIRGWLTPYMGQMMLTPTFVLAVAVSAWVGGIGPALFATVLSAPVLWFGFIAIPSAVVVEGRTGEILGLALFVTVALSIAGITSALRVTQSRSATLRADVRARDAALDESEARFRDMADEAPAMIWLCDPQAKCTFFSRAWLDFTGRTLDQERGDGWTQSIHPEDARRVLHTLRNAMQRREPFRIEYRLRHNDGTYRRIADHGRPRIDREGRFVGFIGACMEVTERPGAAES